MSIRNRLEFLHGQVETWRRDQATKKKQKLIEKINFDELLPVEEKELIGQLVQEMMSIDETNEDLHFIQSLHWSRPKPDNSAEVRMTMGDEEESKAFTMIFNIDPSDNLTYQGMTENIDSEVEMWLLELLVEAMADIEMYNDSDYY